MNKLYESENSERNSKYIFDDTDVKTGIYISEDDNGIIIKANDSSKLQQLIKDFNANDEYYNMYDFIEDHGYKYDVDSLFVYVPNGYITQEDINEIKEANNYNYVYNCFSLEFDKFDEFFEGFFNYETIKWYEYYDAHTNLQYLQVSELEDFANVEYIDTYYIDSNDLRKAYYRLYSVYNQVNETENYIIEADDNWQGTIAEVAKILDTREEADEEIEKLTE